ncbi:MAG: hypothetical protein ACODAJ_09100 [Planctomycetota bacterium]
MAKRLITPAPLKERYGARLERLLQGDDRKTVDQACTVADEVVRRALGDVDLTAAGQAAATRAAGEVAFYRVAQHTGRGMAQAVDQLANAKRFLSGAQAGRLPAAYLADPQTSETEGD